MIARWWIFINERFPLVSHLAMISLFVLAHAGMAKTSNIIDIILVFFATLFFFFKLRLYDEIKDYEVDIHINPTRPLPRGLLAHKDLYKMITVCILVELTLFAVHGTSALLLILMSILYSLLMFKEFFIGKYLRPHLTTYAITHTVVTVFLSLSILGFLGHKSVCDFTRADFFFALNNWCLFNIFEFGRKTFASSEERENVESYSKVFGRIGACILVLAMGIISCLLLPPSIYYYLILFLLLIFSLCYIRFNSIRWASLYRAFSSAYIVLIYLTFTIISFITRCAP